VFTFLPFAALLVVPIGLLRWAISKQEDFRRDGAPAWKRVPLPLLLLLVAGALGVLALYPARGQTVVARMNAIVQAALPAADRSALPAEFRGEAIQAIVVPGYPERAKGEYTLDWEKSELGRFAIPRPIHNESEQSAVVARFDNGWEFVCLFITSNADPRCAEVIQIPTSEEEWAALTAPILQATTGDLHPRSVAPHSFFLQEPRPAPLRPLQASALLLGGSLRGLFSLGQERPPPAWHRGLLRE